MGRESKLFFFYLLVKESYQRGDFCFSPHLCGAAPRWWLGPGTSRSCPTVLPSSRATANERQEPAKGVFTVGVREARKGQGPGGIAQSGLGPAQGGSDGALGAEQGCPSQPGLTAPIFPKEEMCPDATEAKGFKNWDDLKKSLYSFTGKMKYCFLLFFLA